MRGRVGIVLIAAIFSLASATGCAPAPSTRSAGPVRVKQAAKKLRPADKPRVEKPKPSASKPKPASLEVTGRMRSPGLPLYKYDDRFLASLGVLVEVGVERIAEGVTWTEYYAVDVPLDLAESIAEQKSPGSSEQTLTAELLEGSLIAFTVDAQGETTDVRPATGRPRPIAGEAGWLDLDADSQRVIEGSIVQWNTDADGTGILRLAVTPADDIPPAEVNIFLDPSTKAAFYGNPETTLSRLASYDKDWEGPYRGRLTIEVQQNAGGLRAVRVTAPKY